MSKRRVSVSELSEASWTIDFKRCEAESTTEAPGNHHVPREFDSTVFTKIDAVYLVSCDSGNTSLRSPTFWLRLL